ncbi:MAG: maleylacetoacetate isomerase [Betaproteobacteria bacterium]
MLKLYSFFRSGTSHRLRIALHLKGIPTSYIPVDLRTEEHLGEAFKEINPQGFVPALVDESLVLTQSPAIIEWLEEAYPEPALLPKDINQRAYVRALAAIIGCDMHPLNNRRILEHLRKQLGQDETAINAWCATWITDGFNAFEALLKRHQVSGQFCYQDTPGLADVYLIPQVESAKRFKVDLSQWPLIAKIEQNCLALEAFKKAAPTAQIDAT